MVRKKDKGKNGILKLDNIELDALKEFGNIGCRNAVISLSNMINKKAYLALSRVINSHVENLIDNVKVKDELSVGIFFEIKGDINGSILLVFEDDSAKKLAALVMGIEDSSTIELDDMALSDLKEISNIIIGSYLNSLADSLDMKLVQSVPHTSIDPALVMVNTVATSHIPLYKTALVNDMDFFVENNPVLADFIVMFDDDQIGKIVEKIHKKLGV